MTEGNLKLAKNGQFLQGQIDRQIQFFRDAFPKSDQEIDMGGAGVWDRGLPWRGSLDT